MAYATTNPPAMISDRIGTGGALWFYQSTDVSTDVDASGYFTDGYYLGMKVGDVVFVVETDNSYLLTIHSVTVVNSTTGAVTVSGAI